MSGVDNFVIERIAQPAADWLASKGVALYAAARNAYSVGVAFAICYQAQEWIGWGGIGRSGGEWFSTLIFPFWVLWQFALVQHARRDAERYEARPFGVTLSTARVQYLLLRMFLIFFVPLDTLWVITKLTPTSIMHYIHEVALMAGLLLHAARPTPPAQRREAHQMAMSGA